MSYQYYPKNDRQELRSAYLDSMRGLLPPAYANAPDEVIAHRIREVFETLTPVQRQAFSQQSLQYTYENISENYDESFGDILRSITTTAPKVLGAVAPVAKLAAPLVGSFIGPIGSMAGKALGGLLGKIPTTPRTPPVPLQGQPSPTGVPAQISPGEPNLQTNPVIAQLMALLSNPQLIQTLLAQLLGGQQQAGFTVQQPGKPTTTIPFSEVMSTLSECAMRAAEASVAMGGYESEDYLMGSGGRYLVSDVTDASERADYVLDLMNNAYPVPEDAEPEYSPYDPLTEWFLDAEMIQ